MKTEIEEKEIEQMSTEQFFAIARRLEDKHAIFYRFWEIGKPIFDRLIPTACIVFNKEGLYAGFHFNIDFWNSLNNYRRDFIISHEMLHVVFNHGVRTKDLEKNSLIRTITNVAVDLVVNHTLVNKFKFKRELCDPENELCWVDTIFAYRLEENPPREIPPEDKSFEYYYNLLMEDKDNGTLPVINIRCLINDHSHLNPEDTEEMIKELDERLTDEEKESIKKLIENNYENDKQAGSGTGNWTLTNLKKEKIKKKEKWETVIKKWAAPFLKEDIKEVEQWARKHRRLMAFESSISSEESMFLPSDMDIEDMFDDNSRIEVWFFLDTSGSCYNLKDRFWAAAASLPEHRFTVRLFNFDDAVHETSFESGKIYGGGGTSFDIIENKIQELIVKEKVKYPKAVFLITDGYGNHVKPQFPERWYWFLSYSCKSYIPAKSHTFNLSDFE